MLTNNQTCLTKTIAALLTQHYELVEFNTNNPEILIALVYEWWFVPALYDNAKRSHARNEAQTAIKEYCHTKQLPDWFHDAVYAAEYSPYRALLLRTPIRKEFVSEVLESQVLNQEE